ncbi:VOC family protein [Xanthomonas medicagonis]|uniref:VOC family protein n=1 Tax=Xanthomonas medicagonis TaxID=3160841 RepID=UPI0035181C8E
MYPIVLPLFAEDLRRSAAFYAATGLCAGDPASLLVDADVRGTILVELENGPSLRVHRCEDAAVLRYLRAQQPQLEIGEADVAAIAARIAPQLRRGDIFGAGETNCCQGPLDYPGGLALAFCDPDGNRLVFTEW